MSRNITSGKGTRSDRGSYENAVRAKLIVLQTFDEQLAIYENEKGQKDAIEEAFKDTLALYPGVKASSLRTLVFKHLYDVSDPSVPTEVTSCSTPTL